MHPSLHSSIHFLLTCANCLYGVYTKNEYGLLMMDYRKVSEEDFVFQSDIYEHKIEKKLIFKI